MEDFGPINAVPAPHPRVEYDRVETGKLDVLEGDEVAVGGRTAQGARDELVCGILDAREIAEVYLDAECVDALRGLCRIVAGTGAGLEELGGCRELSGMFAQGIDCFLGFLDASGCWDYNEVGRQGSGGQVFVD